MKRVLSPVERLGVNPPVFAEMFASYKVILSNAQTTKVLHIVDIQQIGQISRGHYEVVLTPDTYNVNIKAKCLNRSAEVPQIVSVQAGLVYTFDINIDTGVC